MLPRVAGQFWEMKIIYRRRKFHTLPYHIFFKIIILILLLWRCSDHPKMPPQPFWILQNSAFFDVPTRVRLHFWRILATNLVWFEQVVEVLKSYRESPLPLHFWFSQCSSNCHLNDIEFVWSEVDVFCLHHLISWRWLVSRKEIISFFIKLHLNGAFVPLYFLDLLTKVKFS